jgi:hypothetical protein
MLQFAILQWSFISIEPYCGEKPNDSHPDFYQMQIPKTPGIPGLQYVFLVKDSLGCESV